MRSKNAREPQRRRQRVFFPLYGRSHTHTRVLARVHRQTMRTHRPRGLFLHFGSVERTIYAPYHRAYGDSAAYNTRVHAA